METGFRCVKKRLKLSEALLLNSIAICRVVESQSARNARIFGTVVHGNGTGNSDLDILIDPTPKNDAVRHLRDTSRVAQATWHLTGNLRL